MHHGITLVRFSGTRSCGYFDDLKFIIRIFEKLEKRPGRLGLKLFFFGPFLRMQIFSDLCIHF